MCKHTGGLSPTLRPRRRHKAIFWRTPPGVFSPNNKKNGSAHTRCLFPPKQGFPAERFLENTEFSPNGATPGGKTLGSTLPEKEWGKQTADGTPFGRKTTTEGEFHYKYKSAGWGTTTEFRGRWQPRERRQLKQKKAGPRKSLRDERGEQHTPRGVRRNKGVSSFLRLHPSEAARSRQGRTTEDKAQGPKNKKRQETQTSTQQRENSRDKQARTGNTEQQQAKKARQRAKTTRTAWRWPSGETGRKTEHTTRRWNH